MRSEGDCRVARRLRGRTNLLAALVNLGGTGKYISWGVLQISLANLIIIAVMIVMLVAAIMLPFPKHETRRK
jgi:ABC-type proline/glycine betaine transport system permease subunit